MIGGGERGPACGVCGAFSETMPRQKNTDEDAVKTISMLLQTGKDLTRMGL